MIIINGKTIHLRGKNISYIMYRNHEEDLLNFHFGRRLADMDYSAEPGLLLEPFQVIASTSNHPHLSSLPQEYPAYGRTDQRHPAFQLANGLGNSVSCLKYRDYKIHKGAVRVEGMPSLFADEGAETLEVLLEDTGIGLQVSLYYVIFDEYDIIARSAVIRNISGGSVLLTSAYSANFDLPMGEYDLIHFSGDWCREFGLERTSLSHGALIEIADNTGRGNRWNNPFVMIAAPGVDETHGEVYGFSLIYSGNHSSVAYMDREGRLRIQQGISPQSFRWELKPGEEFHTPQCAACFSGGGFGDISWEYHRLFREHLMRSSWADKQRPVLLNSWEGCYFDFDEERLLAMAKRATQAGIELFVLDDGWFAKRDSAGSSLGDWIADARKLPTGLGGLAKKLNAIGLKFGLWFEPEMVSPDSELYRAHPDWAVRVPQLDPIEYRYQLVLDLTKQEVRDHIVEAVSSVLRSAAISYVKWDMNRIICDPPFDGFYHSYVLGYYDIVRRLTEAFPDVLFEGCCSGGGRFDPGVMQYMPQIWLSDNTDAVSRLKIQYSASMCYPLSSMGAHVSAVPNHQVGRVTDIDARAAVAYTGMFGYELDMTKLDDSELETVARQTAFAKHIQPLVRTGRFHRLRSPYETNECIWEVVSEDAGHAFVMAFRVLSTAKKGRHYDSRVRLRGLDEDAVYEDVLTGARYSGSLLMHRGIIMDHESKDFAAITMELRRV